MVESASFATKISKLFSDQQAYAKQHEAKKSDIRSQYLYPLF